MPENGESSTDVVFDRFIFLSFLTNVSSVNNIKAMPAKATCLCFESSVSEFTFYSFIHSRDGCTLENF